MKSYYSQFYNYADSKKSESMKWEMMLTDKQVGQVAKITGEVYEPY